VERHYGSANEGSFKMWPVFSWFVLQRFSLMERKLESSEGMEFNT
jgi:hypothetical protein